MEKYKAESRNVVNTANKHADTAINKYESEKRKNKSLSEKLGSKSRQLDVVSQELKEIKTRRADVQRMRKNAPVAYLNQLHNDPRLQEKKHSRRSRMGKENSFDRR